VKLTDFGIAKAAHGRQHKTRTGHTKGKLAYMSPEQVRGEALDARSDLFAVGIVLYELLAGAHPFDADTDLALLHNILEGKYRALTEVAPELPKELNAFVGALLEPDVARRPANAGVALAAISGLGNNFSSQRQLAAIVQQHIAQLPAKDYRAWSPVGADPGSNPDRGGSGDLGARDGATQVLPNERGSGPRGSHHLRATTRDVPATTRRRSHRLIFGLAAAAVIASLATWALLRSPKQHTEEAAERARATADGPEHEAPAAAEKPEAALKPGESAGTTSPLPSADLPPSPPVAPPPAEPAPAGESAGFGSHVFNQGAELPAQRERSHARHRREAQRAPAEAEPSSESHRPRTRSGLGVSPDEF
jgi:serine/threonine-protein kinase